MAARYPHCKKGYAHLAFLLGDYDLAAQQYHSARNSGDGAPGLLLSLAGAYRAAGKLEEARDALMQAQVAGERSWHLEQETIRIDRSAGDHKSAYARLDMIEETMSTTIPQRSFRAEMLMDEGCPAEAIPIWRQVVSSAPEEARAVFGLAKCLADIGHVSEAIAILMRLREQAPDFEQTYSMLMLLYRKQRQWRRFFSISGEAWRYLRRKDRFLSNLLRLTQTTG
jgi:tetratricopeptide (TPR) repeat protein